MRLTSLAVQDPTAVDSQTVDSLRGVVPESPLPGGAAEVVRFFFNVPQWIQIGGALLGVALAIALTVLAWRRRRRWWGWFTGQPTAVRRGAVVAAAVMVVLASVAGYRSWDYMQHDNDFCTACHVMGDPFTRFNQSEHDTLSCHDCHQQSIVASTRQLYLWVAERPVEIGEHAPVPDRICEECHVTDQPEVWQRVAETAGHRAHYESDSVDLADVMCVTCHGQEAHRFAPVDQTCGQSGCHENQDITLAGMANQTALHCAACHQFTTEVPRLATTDSARGTLRPGLAECNSCHEMQEALATFVTELDPHNGTCGMCHNPHTQGDASEATNTCTTSGCHDTWETEPFHVGPAHLDVARACTTCHVPHQARVDASNCQDCHARVARDPTVAPAVRRRLRSVAPFDTTAALRRGRADNGAAANPRPAAAFWRFQVHGPPGVGWMMSTGTEAPADSFSHREHETLTCLTCHTTAAGHGALTFNTPRGCQICHHQAPATSQCATCHADPINSLVSTVTIAVGDSTPRVRAVTWDHGVHTTGACVECHEQPVTLQSSPDTQTCISCHDDHHQAQRECSTCHTDEDRPDVHRPPAEAHVGCDTCHDPATVASLAPDRALCLTCHEAQRTDHFESSQPECTPCHFLEPPDRFRRRLTSPRR